jgi:hypothetical protein
MAAAAPHALFTVSHVVRSLTSLNGGSRRKTKIWKFPVLRRTLAAGCRGGTSRGRHNAIMRFRCRLPKQSSNRG